MSSKAPSLPHARVMPAASALPKRRKASRAERRQQLVRATIESIAVRGFSETTLAHVSKTAGLSQGIVNLHFQTKEMLFLETLRFLRDEFRSAWGQALEKAGENPVLQLNALVSSCFKPSICARKKLAGWFAFLAEAKARPLYREICEAHDMAYYEALLSACQHLRAQGGYEDMDPARVALALEAMIEGLWLSIYLSPTDMDRKTARGICRTFLAQFFPQHAEQFAL